MRVAFATHTFLDDPGHYERCIRWFKYHAGMKPPDWDFIAIDNGSSLKAMDQMLTRLAYSPKASPRFVSFSRQMIRDGLAGYEYTWRLVAFMRHFAKFWEYDRIVFCESDFFICSQRMLDYAKIAEGLSTVWCQQYRFPESAFIVYTPGSPLDAFFPNDDWTTHLGSIIEERLPWTFINREMIGDRYENPGSTPRGGVDFSAQQQLNEPVPIFSGEYQ